MTWYVVSDGEDGPFLTQERPEVEAEIMFETEDQTKAEEALCVACNDHETSYEGDMNASARPEGETVDDEDNVNQVTG